MNNDDLKLSPPMTQALRELAEPVVPTGLKHRLLRLKGEERVSTPIFWRPRILVPLAACAVALFVIVPHRPPTSSSPLVHESLSKDEVHDLTLALGMKDSTTLANFDSDDDDDQDDLEDV